MGFSVPVAYASSGGLLHHFSPLPTVAAVYDVCLTAPCSFPALIERRYNFGGMFSVALSVGTTRAVTARVYPGSASLRQRLQVTRHRAYGVRTFLPAAFADRSDPPPFQNHCQYTVQPDETSFATVTIQT